MHLEVVNGRGLGFLWGLLSLALIGAPSADGADRSSSPFTNAVVLSVANKVEVLRQGAVQKWDEASVKPPYHLLSPGDRLRTGVDSRALLRLSNLSDLPVGELSQLEIPLAQKERTVIRLLRGALYFFHRDRPGEFQVDTPTVSAVVRGTEFNVVVADDGTTTFRLLDGAMEMSNEFGRVELRSGEEGVAAPGQAPVRTAVIMTRVADVIQWCLYYPGVLHVDELNLSADDQRALRESLAAYRRGDLLAALGGYPAGREPVSGAEKVYRAALLLAVGKVSESEKLIDTLAASEAKSLGQAIKTLIAAVKFDPLTSDLSPLTNSPTAWLAESYSQQSQFHLEAARAAARRAVELAPSFSFAWTQLAELEFGFGRTRKALVALEKSLHLAPRNAQSLALKGFLLVAQDKLTEAIHWFDEAILTDGALGNAWLGRGLCRIRQGQSEAGRADLQVAATLEPQRSLLRSYLGKAFSHAGDDERALHELKLARQLDPGDPTSWLYSALIKQQQNRINEAVRDLERSEELNANRRVYRSRLLLDEDRAVRGANLANIYRDAGMADVSAREAVRAVDADPANYSAHLFLANSFNELRDPRLFDIRYETPWFSEYLLASLLAPVGAGTLSPRVSQQEYSNLFEPERRLGFTSSTEYWSRGDWVQSATQYGYVGGLGYALDASYRSERGERSNSDLEQSSASLTLKQQFSARNSLFLQTTSTDTEGGDVARYYSPTNARPGYRFHESQEPILVAGFHHEWQPGSHSLVLVSRAQDTVRFSDPAQPVLSLSRFNNEVVRVPAEPGPTADASYRSDFEAWLLEAQQITVAGRHSLIAGARFQTGQFDSLSDLGQSTDFVFVRADSPGVSAPRFTPPQRREFPTSFQRWSLYAYDRWNLVEALSLTAGLSYDWLESPINFQYAPTAPGERTAEQLSPKAGFFWTPRAGTTLRGAYTRSLGGVVFDQSFRLEPTHVGGFNQAFRSLIPESVVGAVAGARFETWGLGWDQRFGSNTYSSVEVERLQSHVRRTLGAVELTDDINVIFVPGGTDQQLDYDERTLRVSLHRLAGQNWAFGAQYRLSEADLRSHFVEIAPEVTLATLQQVQGVLHQMNLLALFNHESGFFSQFDTIWSHQSNRGYAPRLPGDDFWQFNLSAGYRFWHRRMEAKIALLNLADRDYRLNPLTLTTDLPRQRTLVTSFRFNF